MLSHKQKIGLIVLGVASLIPIWSSGGKGGLNFWQFTLNHTIFNGGPEYVPEEDYIMYASKVNRRF